MYPKFGATFAAGLRRRRVRAGDKWHFDEVLLKINGKRHWLWRAVDQNGVVLDILVQERRDHTAAERFLHRVLDGEGGAESRVVITYKLASYPPAIRQVLPHAEQAHQAAGYVTPTTDAQVRLVFQGIRRTLGWAPDQKNAAITAEVRAMVETLSPTSLLGVRDRALLLVGFAGAFRRSELVSLDVADVTFGRDGLIVQLRRSKTDQEGEGRKVGLPFGSNPLTCPVRSLRAWLESAAIARGPIFRPVDRHGNIAVTRLTDQSVALIVKRCAKAAGLDWERYAGHSLRSGLATAAAMADVSERAIMAQTGHKSLPMVRRYIRDGSLFRSNAAAAVGL